MESTPNVTFRLKRRLETLYVESPAQITMCDENIINNEIKTALVFDEDSSDSGFNEEFKQQITQKNTLNNSFSNKFDQSINLSYSYIDDNTTTLDSASKRMKFINTTKFDENDIKTALEQDDSAHLLIGDKTKQHILPVLQHSKHRDLASISSQTMVDLLSGNYDNEVEKYIVIDARYPYEYDGGHIGCAKNLFLKEALIDYLFKHQIQLKDQNKRLIVIFHCEFSSERGPKLMREIRQYDRTINKHCYPSLTYPEIYLLEGGYKNFFETHKDYCLPKSYKPMLHDDHRSDLKYFRKKSKSWELETRKTKLCKSKLLF